MNEGESSIASELGLVLGLVETAAAAAAAETMEVEGDVNVSDSSMLGVGVGGDGGDGGGDSGANLMSDLEPISPSWIRNLDPAEQEAVIERLALVNRRATSLAARCASHLGYGSSSSGRRHALPLSRMLQLSSARSGGGGGGARGGEDAYSKMALWQAIDEASTETCSRVDILHETIANAAAAAAAATTTTAKKDDEQGEDGSGGGREEEEEEKKEGNVVAKNNDDGGGSGEAANHNPTFSDFLLSSITNHCSDELDRVRREPGFDGASVDRLVDSLRAGAGAFDQEIQRLWLQEADAGYGS